MKSILITLAADIPDAEVGKAAAITVGTAQYQGILKAIIVHEATAVNTSVTLEGVGLKLKVPAP